MRKFISTTALIIFVVILLPQHAFSTIIAQVDFESWPANWNCSVNGGDIGGWSSQSCRFEGGVWNERVGPGYNGGRALENTFSSATSNGYNLIYTAPPPPWPSNTQEIYNRWYMKIDPGLDKSISQANSLKFWRYYTPNNTAEIYLHVIGSTFRTGNIELESTEYLPPKHWVLTSVASVADGTWHCLELRIKLNSTSSTADGETDFWLDGVLIRSHRNQIFSPTAIPTFKDVVQFGVGNFSDEPWNNASPLSFSFDNYILSTTYNGPIGGAGVTIIPPPAPTALQVQ